jgi:hypothetical protein
MVFNYFKLAFRNAFPVTGVFLVMVFAYLMFISSIQLALFSHSNWRLLAMISSILILVVLSFHYHYSADNIRKIAILKLYGAGILNISIYTFFEMNLYTLIAFTTSIVAIDLCGHVQILENIYRPVSKEMLMLFVVVLVFNILLSIPIAILQSNSANPNFLRIK